MHAAQWGGGSPLIQLLLLRTGPSLWQPGASAPWERYKLLSAGAAERESEMEMVNGRN